ncbi:predicted protein, partial [Nematostella vectensis]
FSFQVAAVFLFNVLTGVGILALPSSIAKAGIISGSICLTIVAFMAFVSATFLIEVLSTANAWVRFHPIHIGKGQTKACAFKEFGEKLVAKSKSLGLTNPFEIVESVELGQMTELFLGTVGSTLFYAVLCLYLFGDLAIYAVSVATTLTRVLGSQPEISYYSFLLGFIMVIGPFCFFNFQKTKVLQLSTMVLRNTAMVLMIVLVINDIASGKRVPINQVVLFDMEETKELLGTAVFSFMCHHTISSLIMLIRDKHKALAVFLFDYTIELLYCSVLVGTAILSRPPSEINALYTLTFRDYPVEILAKFLSFYPVFTLSSNFPLICITLRNNLLTLFNISAGFNPWSLDQPIFTLVALIPPMTLAAAVHDVSKLVVLTGSFAGLAIMLLTPAFLVLYSRRKLKRLVGPNWHEMHPHLSPFQHNAWIYLVLAFAAFVFLIRVF